MFKVRLSVFFLASCAVVSLSKAAQTLMFNSGDTVMNAPYSAERRFTSIDKSKDGAINSSQSCGSEARDSKGRTYSAGERHWTYYEDGKLVLKSEILYRLHDPVASTDTQWDTTSREVKVIHWPKTWTKQSTANASCSSCSAEKSSRPNERIEKLGTETLSGVVVEGTRASYTISGSKGPPDSPAVVIHESWYCPELKISLKPTMIRVAEEPGTNLSTSFVESQKSANTIHLRITSRTKCTYPGIRHSKRTRFISLVLSELSCQLVHTCASKRVLRKLPAWD